MSDPLGRIAALPARNIPPLKTFKPAKVVLRSRSHQELYPLRKVIVFHPSNIDIQQAFNKELNRELSALKSIFSDEAKSGTSTFQTAFCQLPEALKHEENQDGLSFALGFGWDGKCVLIRTHQTFFPIKGAIDAETGKETAIKSQEAYHPKPSGKSSFRPIEGRQIHFGFGDHYSFEVVDVDLDSGIVRYKISPSTNLETSLVEEGSISLLELDVQLNESGKLALISPGKISKNLYANLCLPEIKYVGDFKVRDSKVSLTVSAAASRQAVRQAAQREMEPVLRANFEEVLSRRNRSIRVTRDPKESLAVLVSPFIYPFDINGSMVYDTPIQGVVYYRLYVPPLGKVHSSLTSERSQLGKENNRNSSNNPLIPFPFQLTEALNEFPRADYALRRAWIGSSLVVFVPKQSSKKPSLLISGGNLNSRGSLITTSFNDEHLARINNAFSLRLYVREENIQFVLIENTAFMNKTC